MPPPRRRTLRTLTLLGVVMTLAACGREPTAYPASTPDEALDAAQQMLATGEAGRLTELVYAFTSVMRSFLF